MFCLVRNWSTGGAQQMCLHSIWHGANIPLPLKRTNGNCYFLPKSLKCTRNVQLCIAQYKQKKRKLDQILFHFKTEPVKSQAVFQKIFTM